MNEQNSNSNFELPIQLPFLKMGNSSSVLDFIDSLSELIDRNAVPHNRLPFLWSVHLGYISDEVEENQCAFVYSPALMGRKLNVNNKDDILYIMYNAVEQWNSGTANMKSNTDPMQKCPAPISFLLGKKYARSGTLPLKSCTTHGWLSESKHVLKRK